MVIDLEIARLCKNGLPITQNEIETLNSNVFINQTVYNRTISNVDIPSYLKDLFEIKNKDDTVKYCRNLTIKEFDFFLLIHNCSQLNFTHKSKFLQFVPPQWVLNDVDKEEMKNGNIRPISKKLKAILLQRRYLHAHLFQNKEEWHCFYFSFSELEVTNNHWKNGPHIHYVNNLMSNLGVDDLWNCIDQRNTKIPGKNHIKFKPFEFPEDNIFQESTSTNKKVLQPANEFIFDADYALHHQTEPTPVALITTRGFWVSNAFLPTC